MIKDYFNPNAPKRVWQNMWILCGAIATAALISIAFAQTKSEKGVWPEHWDRHSWPAANYEISMHSASIHPPVRTDQHKSSAENIERFVQIRSRSDAGENGYGAISQTIDAKKFLGKTIRLSAETRAQDVAAVAARLGVWFYAKDGRPVGGGDTSAAGIRSLVDWRDSYVIVKVPTDAFAMEYGLMLRGNGTVAMKDFAITEMPNDTPTMAETPWWSKRLVKLTSPTNLSFK